MMRSCPTRGALRVGARCGTSRAPRRAAPPAGHTSPMDDTHDHGRPPPPATRQKGSGSHEQHPEVIQRERQLSPSCGHRQQGRPDPRLHGRHRVRGGRRRQGVHLCGRLAANAPDRRGPARGARSPGVARRLDDPVLGDQPIDVAPCWMAAGRARTLALAEARLLGEVRAGRCGSSMRLHCQREPGGHARAGLTGRRPSFASRIGRQPPGGRSRRPPSSHRAARGRHAVRRFGGRGRVRGERDGLEGRRPKAS